MINIKRNLENLLLEIRIAAEEVCGDVKKLGDDVKKTAGKVLSQTPNIVAPSVNSTPIDERNDLLERQRQIIQEQREVQENLVIDNFRTLQMQRRQEEILLEQNRIIEQQRRELERLSKIHEEERQDKNLELRRARIESQLEKIRLNKLINAEQSNAKTSRALVAA